MGEIADMMINGETCAQCGTLTKRFENSGEGWGFPVLCDDCWDPARIEKVPPHGIQMVDGCLCEKALLAISSADAADTIVAATGSYTTRGRRK